MTVRKHILRWSILCFGCGAYSAGIGQIVVNGSFESLNALPTDVGLWNLAEGWSNASSASADPDVFHISGLGGGDLPETPVAIVQPYQGLAIGGFSASSVEGTNRREYWTGSFSEALVPGTHYELSFAMTNGHITAFSAAGLAISGLGMYFSDSGPVQLNHEPLALTPHFTLNQVFFDREWQSVSIRFTATDHWQYFTWGVFGDDSGHLIEAVEGENPQLAYYFVDAFTIVPISSEMMGDMDGGRGPGAGAIAPDDADPTWFVPNAFTPNGDGENEWFRPVLNNVEFNRFVVYNRWGHEVWQMESSHLKGWDGKGPKGVLVAAGSYVWQLEVKGLEGKLHSHTGTVHVLY